MKKKTNHWLAVGAQAPGLEAIDQDGAPVDLGREYAEGRVLIYFYLRSGTPVCTIHACRLRDGFAELHERNIKIFGVSSDPPERLKGFKARNRLPFRLISDTKGRLTDAFGVTALFGLPARRAFLICEGVVVWEGHASAAAIRVSELVSSQARVSA